MTVQPAPGHDDRSAYFDRIAGEWDYWRAKNSYYHHGLLELLQGVVPPNSDVLDIGAGTGEVLAALHPRRGVGLNISPRLSEISRKKHPEVEVYRFELDRVVLPGDFQPQYIVLANMLDHVRDMWDLFESIRSCMTADSLLVLTTTNPLWAPVLRLGSRAQMRIPDSPRNYITNRDISAVLNLQGFDVVESGHILPVPKRVPVLSDILNLIIPDVPVLRYSSSVQYLAARLRVSRPHLSATVVIPCHNEAGNIEQCISRTPTIGTGTEIIVVDDGSTDETRAVVRAVMEVDARVRLVTYDQNHGKANAVRAGFAAATGDVLMILDADMTVPPEALSKFLSPLQAGTADFVNGTRLVYPRHGRAMPMRNYLGNKAFCFLASWALRQRVSDTLCGTKALLRRDYERMPLPGVERWGDFDLLFGAARARLRILEIPVHYGDRRAGTSKMRVGRDGWLFLKACMSGWWRLRRPKALPWDCRVKVMGASRLYEPATPP